LSKWLCHQLNELKDHHFEIGFLRHIVLDLKNHRPSRL